MPKTNEGKQDQVNKRHLSRYEPLEQLLEQQFSNLTIDLPYRRQFEISVDPSNGFDENTGQRLTATFAFTHPVFSIWAAGDFVNDVCIFAKKTEPRITKIVFSTNPANPDLCNVSMYWKVEQSYWRKKKIRESTFRSLEKQLRKTAAEALLVNGWCNQKSKRLQGLGSDDKVQIAATLNHLAYLHKAGIMEIEPKSALNVFRSSWDAQDHQFQFGGNLSRYRVMNFLVDQGVVRDTNPRQLLLRPPAEVASCDEIWLALSKSGLICKPGKYDPKSHKPDRVHARYFAAWVMRKVTGRSLEFVSKTVRRNHSTLTYGLNCVDGWRQNSPTYHRLLDICCQVADDIGICKSPNWPGWSKRSISGK